MDPVHCFCNLLDPKVGKRVDPEISDHMRNGIPCCSQQCADRYDRMQQQREINRQFFEGMKEHQRSRVGGQMMGRSKQRSFDVV